MYNIIVLAALGLVWKCKASSMNSRHEHLVCNADKTRYFNKFLTLFPSIVLLRIVLLESNVGQTGKSYCGRNRVQERTKL